VGIGRTAFARKASVDEKSVERYLLFATKPDAAEASKGKSVFN
jgi:hypothetical protein